MGMSVLVTFGDVSIFELIMQILFSMYLDRGVLNGSFQRMFPLKDSTHAKLFNSLSHQNKVKVHGLAM